jgi:hypothetical protein
MKTNFKKILSTRYEGENPEEVSPPPSAKMLRLYEDGFRTMNLLGVDESLLDLVVSDSQTVSAFSTNKRISEILRVIGEGIDGPGNVDFNGLSFDCNCSRERIHNTLGYVDHFIYSVSRNDEEIKFSMALASLIAEIGFYGGKDSKYRADPAKFKRMFFPAAAAKPNR